MYPTFKIFKSIAIVAALVGQLAPDRAFAASATGTAVQDVLAAIAITNVSNLDFGNGSAGDPAKTVVPGTVENAVNGSFNVTGAANTAYTITLPTTITMITGPGGANRTIVVNTFTSFPAAGANGLLSAGGAQLLLIGATRAALGAGQIVGAYAATYVVTVVY